MSSNDWEEVKRLAADFQRAQLSDGAQTLSERNCREIVNRLIELELINVIHSTDGKEYLTQEELGKEIREELEVHGGRVNLVSLAQLLQVDFRHIEDKTNELLKADGTLQLVLGQIINRTYIEHLCEEVNDKLQEVGCISIGDLAKSYDLPADFILQCCESRIGSGNVISGQLERFDGTTLVIYTDDYISRITARVRGLFTACTRPTSIQAVISKYGFHERLLYSILDKLLSSEGSRVSGSVVGSHSERATYIPTVYARQQREWVQTFYAHNGYLEYSALQRAGISDLNIKKADKKRDRQVVFSHRQSLMESLRVEQEASMVLHLTALVLFTAHTQHMLPHASGKFVPHIIAMLQPLIPPDHHTLLLNYQGLVMKQLSAAAAAADGGGAAAAAEVEQQLVELKEAVKQSALASKKPAGAAT